MSLNRLFTFAALALSVVATAQNGLETEVQTLKDRSVAITKEISKLTADGTLSQDEKAIEQLQKLVEELAELNKQLKKLQSDVDELKKTNPKIREDLDNLARTRNRSYIQFQWNDGQNNPSTPRPNDGFAIRRMRFTQEGVIDKKNQYKLSVELAANANRLGAELRDVALIHDATPFDKPGGLRVTGGQYTMPLGSELVRSSAEREFPERAAYNQRLFAGERNRGISGKYRLDDNWTVGLGLWNALTISDPQQTELNTFRNASGTRPGATGEIRYQDKNLNAGISGFMATRPDLTYRPDSSSAAITTDSGERRFVYLDAAWKATSYLTLRGEAMFGRDRVPTFSGSGANRRTAQSFGSVRGSQLQLDWMINPKNTLSARYEFFDPNIGPDDNVFGYGLAWNHLLSPNVRLTLAHEIFREQGFDLTNNVTTIRVQYRFR